MKINDVVLKDHFESNRNSQTKKMDSANSPYDLDIEVIKVNHPSQTLTGNNTLATCVTYCNSCQTCISCGRVC